MKPWTLAQLIDEQQGDLQSCTSAFEQINCKAMYRVDIKRLAEEIRKTRKLTPGEESILANT